MDCLSLPLPHHVSAVLSMLEHAGYEAFVVGGCVRDALRGVSPHDYDVTTNALPEDVLRVFSGYTVIPTGIAHGTVTVLYDRIPIEVTTYRIDGNYPDHRHPQSVSFTRNLRDDAARRDFTINAMAWSPQRGLMDFFRGEEDLKHGVIRAVGDPKKRFEEDALRILRALRFSSVLGFRIEEKTDAAIFSMKELLTNISAERIRDEFLRLLCGNGAEDVLRRYAKVIAVFLPMLSPMFGFEQHNPWHCYDVWEHTLHVLGGISPLPALRLSALLHDCGKPDTFFQDENGIGHFHGHPKQSLILAEAALDSLRVDNHLKDDTLTLIREHDTVCQTDPQIRRLLSRIGETRWEALTELWEADNRAQSQMALERIPKILHVRNRGKEILQEKSCLSLRDLAVSGADMIALGICQGPAIGAVLQWLLNAVIDEKLPNDKEILCRAAQQWKEKSYHDERN